MALKNNPILFEEIAKQSRRAVLVVDSGSDSIVYGNSLVKQFFGDAIAINKKKSFEIFLSSLKKSDANNLLKKVKNISNSSELENGQLTLTINNDSTDINCEIKLISINEIKYVLIIMEKQQDIALRAQNILESISDAFLLISHKGNLVYINSLAANLVRGPKENLIGRNIRAVFPKNIYTKFIKQFQSSVRTGKSFHTEYYFDNNKKWFEVHAYPSVNGVSIYLSDITEEKKTEQALAQSQRLFNALYDSNIIGIFYGDLNGTIFQANDTFLGLIGYTRADLEKKPIDWLDITPKEYLAVDRKLFKHLKKVGVFPSYEKEYIRKDGSQIPVLVGRILLNPDSTETLTFVLDITERKKLEQKKDEFISIASHELKTPLTSIKGYIQLIEKLLAEKNDPKLMMLLGKTDMYIDRLNKLIIDLLDVSRVQAGKLQMNMEEFDFDKLSKEAVDGMQYVSEKHTIVLKGKTNACLYGDKDRLEQVFTNLISNAIKYSPDADKVIVTLHKFDNKVRVSVEDFGVGIPKSKQSRIFERFFRVESTAHQFTGLGIGLHISSEIVKMHKGKIWVESDKGKGSTFIFELPISK